MVNSLVKLSAEGKGKARHPLLLAKPFKNNHQILDLEGGPTGTTQTREGVVAVVLGPTSVKRRKKWQQHPNVRGVRGQRSDLNSHHFIVSEIAIF
jgi:hypothetical protein